MDTLKENAKHMAGFGLTVGTALQRSSAKVYRSQRGKNSWWKTLRDKNSVLSIPKGVHILLCTSEGHCPSTILLLEAWIEAGNPNPTVSSSTLPS